MSFTLIHYLSLHKWDIINDDIRLLYLIASIGQPSIL